MNNKESLLNLLKHMKQKLLIPKNKLVNYSQKVYFFLDFFFKYFIFKKKY